MPEVNLENLISKLNPSAKAALEKSLAMVVSYQQETAEVEHWLYQMLRNNDVELLAICKHFAISVTVVEKSLLQAIEKLPRKKATMPTLGQGLIDLFNKSWQLASLEYNRQQLTSAYIICAMLDDIILQQKALMLVPVLKQIDLLELKQLLKQEELSQQEVTPVNKAESLKQFTIDLVAEAKAGKIDPVIGREAEIRQAIDILMRRRQNNPILTGEPGVGKTAIVEGLALRIAEGKVPNNLAKVKIHSLDLGLLQAGAGVKGEFERRLKDLISDIEKSANPIILFVDEAHTLIGAGGAPGQMDAANILKPALARGALRVIAATTWAEYKQYIESDAALTRRFQVVKVNAPDEETACHMLRSMAEKLEEHHEVTILAEAITTAVRLSKRYLTERQLPDSAISVLDTACARVSDQQNDLPVEITSLQESQRNIELEIKQLNREEQTTEIKKQIKQLQVQLNKTKKEIESLQKEYESQKQLIQQIKEQQAELSKCRSVAAKRKPTSVSEANTKLKALLKTLKKQQETKTFINLNVNKTTVADVIANWTGIPAANMLRGSEDRILSLQSRLAEKIIGQKYALQAISNKLLASGAKLTATNKPTGVFLLVGPSGVGKTETAHVLATEIFGSANKMTIINMSEFKEAHKVATLIGSPPGYVGYGKGGVLTEAIRREPYSLILLDEMEKAHPSVQELFFQMFDKGIIRDSEGRDIDCKNTLIIMTSNAASDFIIDHANAGDDFSDTKLQQKLNKELTKSFAPAFLGRTAIVPYMPLTEAELTQIVERELIQLSKRAEENYNIKINFNESVNLYLTAACQQQSFGARQIYNNISQQLLPTVSEKLLQTIAKKKPAKQLQVTRQEEAWVVI